jgi:hypothetical protein
MKAGGFMKRRNWVTVMAGGLLAALAQLGQAMGPRPRGFGVVVNSGLMNGTQPKHGVEIQSDSGRHLAGFATARSRDGPGVGQTSGYGGMGLPEWVEVSWREPIRGKKFIPSTGNTIDTLDFGQDLGRFRIEVASRIPEEVVRYASAERGRAIKLMFRILDDDVVMGWCVQEPSKLGGGWIFSNFGGDFVPAMRVRGEIVEMGWYLDRKTGQRVETTTGH